MLIDPYPDTLKAYKERLKTLGFEVISLTYENQDNRVPKELLEKAIKIISRNFDISFVVVEYNLNANIRFPTNEDFYTGVELLKRLDIKIPRLFVEQLFSNEPGHRWEEIYQTHEILIWNKLGLEFICWKEGAIRPIQIAMAEANIGKVIAIEKSFNALQKVLKPLIDRA